MTAARLARPLVGLVISAACVVLLLRVVSPAEIGESLRAGNPMVLVPAIALYFAGAFVRSVRWKALLRGQAVGVWLLFKTLVIGLMVNDLLPLRLGEVARVALLARNAAVPIGVSLASIVVERVFDGVALTFLLAAGIILSGERGWLLQLAAGSTVLFAVATGVLLWAALWPRPARRLGYVVAGLMPRRFGGPFRRLVDGMLAGLAPLAHWSVVLPVLALSLIAWTIEALMYLTIMVGFQVPGGLAAAFVGTAAANLASLVPAAPGYVGTFDLALREVLVGMFDASAAAATSYTIVVHLTLIVPVVLVGLFFLWRENVSLPELGRHRLTATERSAVGVGARK
jgi:uncharacterized protein (TIRG00374 family)